MNAPQIPSQAQAQDRYLRITGFPDEVGSRGEFEFMIRIPEERVDSAGLVNADGDWFTGHNCQVSVPRTPWTTMDNWFIIAARVVVDPHPKDREVRVDVGPKFNNYRAALHNRPTVDVARFQEPLRAQAQILLVDQPNFNDGGGEDIVIPHFATVLWNTATNLDRMRASHITFDDPRFRAYRIAPHPTNGNVNVGVIAPRDPAEGVTMHIAAGAIPPGTADFIGGSSHPDKKTFNFTTVNNGVRVTPTA